MEFDKIEAVSKKTLCLNIVSKVYLRKFKNNPVLVQKAKSIKMSDNYWIFSKLLSSRIEDQNLSHTMGSTMRSEKTKLPWTSKALTSNPTLPPSKGGPRLQHFHWLQQRKKVDFKLMNSNAKPWTCIGSTMTLSTILMFLINPTMLTKDFTLMNWILPMIGPTLSKSMFQWKLEKDWQVWKSEKVSFTKYYILFYSVCVTKVDFPKARRNVKITEIYSYIILAKISWKQIPQK